MDDERDAIAHAISRRRALAGAAGLGVVGPLLAACGGGDDGAAGDDASASGSPSADGPLTTTGDVPVGGGVVLADNGVVVTQPTEGDFKGFSSICTHQGCPVSSVEGGTINCTCHGSKFSIEDGSVANGPATQPLAAVDVTVSGDEVSLA